MKKSNKKYVYEDFLLKKQALKQEIEDMEKMLSLEHLPETLGVIGGNLKEKALNLIQNPNTLNLLLGAGISFGIEKLISRFISKKSATGKAALLAFSYLIPSAIDMARNIMTNPTIQKKKRNKP
ncbi:MAG: hypothetical protein LBP34_08675 [Flavobacteriaceae bacterium]|nr:hypothetical protein [Flavobacteriaceae bacterium]